MKSGNRSDDLRHHFLSHIGDVGGLQAPAAAIGVHQRRICFDEMPQASASFGFLRRKSRLGRVAFAESLLSVLNISRSNFAQGRGISQIYTARIACAYSVMICRIVSEGPTRRRVGKKRASKILLQESDPR